MNRLPVVLDKSFAHPKKAETIKEWLCKERTVILPRAFYYEVFTTTDDIRGNRIVTAAQKRIAAIRGMGEHIPLHLPSLLQEEALLKSPLIPPYILSRYPFERFSQSYLSEDWTPKNHQVSILNYYSDHINYMCDFWRNVLISQYIPCFS
ncbi:MAG TPA: hypothetical protein VK970_04810, partial [Candidatus Methylacidiphilales bacterium]|nr:hypothetical protein [Candidatus Methylacidiphilales bacterium]